MAIIELPPTIGVQKNNMSRKNKNIVDVPKAQAFLRDAYGLKSSPIQDYSLRVWREDSFDLRFDWYHTTGKIVAMQEGRNQKNIGFALTDEDLAIIIQKYVA